EIPADSPFHPGERWTVDLVFLASTQASYITGEIVNATGGTPLP
ncbi:NAD(P)-dependent dehydrogenase, partial [Streptomyces goshikiensis]